MPIAAVRALVDLRTNARACSFNCLPLLEKCLNRGHLSCLPILSGQVNRDRLIKQHRPID